MERELGTLRIYILATEYGDKVWELVSAWAPHARNTIGEQWVRAADSVGANIAEGYGRFTFPDRLRFFYYARGSCFESEHWMERAGKRSLISLPALEELKRNLDELNPQLNGYIKRTRQEMLQQGKASGK